MKRTLLILFLGSLVCSAQVTKNVYFIGNSYTGTNNLPNLIQQVAASTQDVLEYQAYTPGGSSFQQHVDNPTVINTINLASWDYVVLQQQSQMPAFPNATSTLEAAAQLSNQIVNANECATPLFFMTWGYRDGDAVNCANGVLYLCTYEGMDDKLYERYMQMTEDNQAVVSPVGRVWRAIRSQYPEYELYMSDGSHPSLLGSMAAAYTFYAVIYKKDPTLVLFNGYLDAIVAQNIKNIVKNVVYDQLQTWKAGINDNPTRFSVSLQQNGIVSFINETQGATEFLWDFGDGVTSTAEHPIHTYSSNQTYIVSLTTNACNGMNTQTKEIQVNTLNILDSFREKVQIFPNPTTDFLKITNLNFNSIKVIDALGKVLSLPIHYQKDWIQIETQSLANGVYWLHITKDHQIHTTCFVKQ